MPLNSAGTSFNQGAINPTFQPSTTEPDLAFTGLTTAQCAANGSLTSKAITSTITLVEAGTKRTRGMRLVVPTDQPQVTFGNSGPTAANPIQPVPQSAAAGGFITTLSSNIVPNGFAVPSGQAIFVAPFNDAMYAVTPAGVTATIYFADV